MTSRDDGGIPRLHNRIFEAEVGRTDTGAIRIQVHASRANGRFDTPGQIAACVYDVAAELERQSDGLGADWSVLPETSGGRIEIEIGDCDRCDEAMRLASTCSPSSVSCDGETGVRQHGIRDACAALPQAAEAAS